MTDVFVSYKAEDRRRVRPLVEALEADGYSVWWDEQIGGGTSWRRAIEAELEAAKCVIVVWSKRSAGPDGTFVQDEATRAQQRHVYVPITIDKVQLPLGFGETQALALGGWHGDRTDVRYRELLSAVRRLSGEAPAAPGTSRKGQVTRRALLAGGAVVIAAGSFGAWALLRHGSAGPPSQTIAVLPFENLSGDPNQAYFSDGIAEEIRSALARLAGLTVIGRTSSEAVRNDDARTAAKKLGVHNILTGTVRQTHSVVRITAELVDGTSGADRWSEDYSRSPGDAIAIQTDIARNVANALSIQLLPEARKNLTASGTTNPLAHDAYLQGIGLARANGDEQLDREAVAQFDAAIARDPAYADAYASKAELLTIIAFLDPTDASTRADLASALSSAEAAVRYAPGRSNAQSALGVVLQNFDDFEGANRAFEKALQLGADSETLRRIALFRARTGAGGSALQLIRRARELDPLNFSIQGDLGVVQFYGRNYQGAIGTLSAYLQDHPNSSRLRDYLLRSLALVGRTAEARAELAKISTDWLRLVDDALLTARSGDHARADQALTKVLGIRANQLAFQIAQIHAQRGDKETAIADLQSAMRVRDAGLQALPTDPFLDPLRADPRFRRLVKQLRFPT
jgi:serine/threonine-protein kinase